MGTSKGTERMTEGEGVGENEGLEGGGKMVNLSFGPVALG